MLRPSRSLTDHPSFINLLDEIENQALKQIGDQTGCPVRNLVWSQVWCQVFSQVGISIYDQLEEELHAKTN